MIGLLLTHPFTCIFIVIFISLLLAFFKYIQGRPNPFHTDVRRQAEPLVVDQKARDKVLKQNFNIGNIPPVIDAIVIGSGPGGLTTAILLAKVGWRVVVLEQHDQAGGCMHTFIDHGYEWDVGIHYIGCMQKGSFERFIYDQLCDGQVQWAELDKNFDTPMIVNDKEQTSYPLESGPEDELRDSYMRNFPDPVDQASINRFFEIKKNCSGFTKSMGILKLLPKSIAFLLVKFKLLSSVNKFLSLGMKSLAETLSEVTSNERLRMALSYSFGDYGTDPSDSPLFMQCLLLNHYKKGSFFPVGGASELAFHMIPLIEKAGGRVFVNAPVTKILFDKRNKANGVIVKQINASGSEEEFTLSSDCIISDAGVTNTFTSLVPRHLAEKTDIWPLLQKKVVKPGHAGLSAFVGLKGTKEELKLPAANYWIFSRPDLTNALKEYFALDADDALDTRVPLMFLSFPSAKDPTWESRYPGKSTATIITLTPWSWFEKYKSESLKKRGAAYKALKDRIGKIMWDITVEVFPHLADAFDYMDVGSAVTNQYYIGSAEGEIYGLDHNRSRFAPEQIIHLRPDSGLKRLWLTGQDVLLCGFSGALMGGVVTASALLRRNLISDCVELYKASPKEIEVPQLPSSRSGCDRAEYTFVSTSNRKSIEVTDEMTENGGKKTN